MPLVIPYRTKNPTDRFPVATVGLITTNVLVYALTSQYFLEVTPEALKMFAVSHNTLNVWRLISSLFIHENLWHLCGNMLFLWIFGPSVEDRLKPLKFMAVYLLAGAVGTLLEDVAIAFHDPDEPCFGASGAIMGLAGAYLYMFPFANIRVFWFSWISMLPRFGFSDWHARWVVLYFVGMDFLNGVILQSADGVGHFAHLGGAVAGFLAVAILQERRDSEDISGAQAMRADLRDVDYLSFMELESLMQHPTENMRLVLAYCDKALLAPGQLGEHKCVTALHYYATPLLESGDMDRLTAILLRLDMQYVRQLPSVYFLRLGSMLEKAGSYDFAVRLYRRMFEMEPKGRDTEVALHRAGRLMEGFYNDHEQARYYYGELLKNFPNGHLADEARRSISTSSHSGPRFR
jgi:membrane associated rhomboid family serine protease